MALVEDAVQHALLSCWQDLAQLRDPARFDAWSYRILVRSCYALSKRARPRLPEVPLDGIDRGAPSHDYSSVIDRDALERGFL